MAITHERTTKIQELPELSAPVKTTDLIEVTHNGKTYAKTLPYLCTAGTIVNYAATKKYYTGPSSEGGNDLTEDDISIFYHTNNLGYPQSGSKEVYFEKHPIIDVEDGEEDTGKERFSVNDLGGERLLSNRNVKNFENHLAIKGRYPCAIIPAFNWRNEPAPKAITTLDYFIPTTSNEERVTYKINFDSDERASNIIKLSDLEKDGHHLTGVIYYTVIGLVSVQSTLEDQRTGTVYLEARANENEEWKTIDSAAFKFLNKSTGLSSPGTYVTLNGYLNANFETRIKLNLNPLGYSMDISQYRLIDEALVTNATNTFVGFAYAPCNNDSYLCPHDDNIYYKICYLWPYRSDFTGKTEAEKDAIFDSLRSFWMPYQYEDLDAGTYTLDGQKHNIYTGIPIDTFPALYRHTRWKNISTGDVYKFKTKITLSPSNTTLDSDGSRKFEVKAVYIPIKYDIIYQGYSNLSGLSLNHTITPTYDYTVKDIPDNKKLPIAYNGKYYRQIGWIDTTNSNTKFDFGQTNVMMNDNTTKQAPGDDDPETHRQRIFEGNYVEAKYKIKYYHGNGLFEDFVDDNNGDYYKEGRVLNLHAKIPDDTSPKGLIVKNGKEWVHYGWKIMDTIYPFEGNTRPEITVSYRLVKEDDRKITSSPWIIKATAVYKRRFKITYSSKSKENYENDDGHREVETHLVEGETHIVYGSQGWKYMDQAQKTKWYDTKSESYRNFGSTLLGSTSNFESDHTLILKAVYPNRIDVDAHTCKGFGVVLANYRDNSEAKIHTFNWDEYVSGYSGDLWVQFTISGGAYNHDDDNWFAAKTTDFGGGSLDLFPFGRFAYGAYGNSSGLGYHFDDDSGHGATGIASTTIKTKAHSIKFYIRAFFGTNVTLCMRRITNFEPT